MYNVYKIPDGILATSLPIIFDGKREITEAGEYFGVHGACPGLTPIPIDNIPDGLQLIDQHAPLDIRVSPASIRKALNQLGLRDGIEAWVALQSRNIRDDWEFSTYISSTNPLIITAQEGLGLTAADVVGIFTLAQTFDV